MSPKQKKTDNTVATNRKAFHNFNIIETYEAGLCLLGPEVKSLRLKHASLEQSFARADKGEMYIYNLHISPYKFNKLQDLEPARTRKLLLKKSEIKRLITLTEIKGNSLVALEIYFKNGWAKVKLGLAKGKKAVDKREDIKRKDAARELRRNFKNSYRK